ncbi:hypothetical protein BC940DRAFT_106452 [Gongronella butleri]|nr:hypothetical protein BC940DRAFT_106452 [Gongronella butleri]
MMNKTKKKVTAVSNFPPPIFAFFFCLYAIASSFPACTPIPATLPPLLHLASPPPCVSYYPCMSTRKRHNKIQKEKKNEMAVSRLCGPFPFVSRVAEMVGIDGERKKQGSQGPLGNTGSPFGKEGPTCDALKGKLNGIAAFQLGGRDQLGQLGGAGRDLCRPHDVIPAQTRKHPHRPMPPTKEPRPFAHGTHGGFPKRNCSSISNLLA